MMNQEIIRADKRHRRKFFVIYILLVSLGAVLFEWVVPWGKEYLQRLDPETALSVVKIALVVMFLSIVPFGLYLWKFGRKVMEHQRFPPPGVKVIRDTRLIEGEKAKVRGQVMVVLALILIVVGLFAAVYTPYILHKANKTEGTESNNANEADVKKPGGLA